MSNDCIEGGRVVVPILATNVTSKVDKLGVDLLNYYSLNLNIANLLEDDLFCKLLDYGQLLAYQFKVVRAAYELFLLLNDGDLVEVSSKVPSAEEVVKISTLLVRTNLDTSQCNWNGRTRRNRSRNPVATPTDRARRDQGRGSQENDGERSSVKEHIDRV